MSDRRLFALSDPHLSLARPKPMDVFGPRWADHVRRLEENWRAAVKPDDIVLMPGDISWGMRLEEAMPDLLWLAALPGRKALIKGNHDYWWQSLGKLRKLGLAGMHFIQNDHALIDGVAIGGTRLWDFPGIFWRFTANATNTDVAPEMRGPGRPETREGDPEKIRARELERLALSLSGLPRDAAVRVAMTHYPPIGEDGGETAITRLIGEMAIDVCVFGHVHSDIGLPRPGEDIVIGKTRYVLAASDHLGHCPKLLMEL